MKHKSLLQKKLGLVCLGIVVLTSIGGVTLAYADFTDFNSIQKYFIELKKKNNQYGKDNERVFLPGETVLILADASKSLRFSYDKDNPIKAQLMSKSEKKQKKALITVPFLEHEDGKIYALVPIPAYVQQGSYRINIVDNNGNALSKKVLIQNFLYIEVGKRNFQVQKVALNRKLAKTKSKPADPNVVKEAGEIWRVTGRVESSDKYDLFGFMLPLKEYKYVTGMYADKRTYTYQDAQEISSTIHGGIDLAAAVGTPVYASGAGRVVLAKYRIVTGKSVVIVHYPGVYTMYYHLDNIMVEEGEMVSKGIQIGESGNSGFSTGPHLHWEMRVNNIRVDPLLSLDHLDKVKTIDIR